MEMKRPRKPQPVGVLIKVFRLLEILGDADQPMNLKSLSEKAGINNSTAYRCLAHMEERGWLVRDGQGNYGLGPKLAHSANGCDPVARLRAAARPFFWGLSKYTGETVNLATMDGADVVFIDGLESPHEFRMVLKSGLRSVFYRIALGKAM